MFVHMRRLCPSPSDKNPHSCGICGLFARLTETFLPPKEGFYIHLSNEGVSDAHYAHACLVWEKSGMVTMKEYQDRYLETDVILGLVHGAHSNRNRYRKL